MATRMIQARFRSAPFAAVSCRRSIRHGASVAEIVDSFTEDGTVPLAARIQVSVGGIVIPEDKWRSVRPKTTAIVEVCQIPQSSQSAVMWTSIAMKVVGTIMLFYPPTAPYGAALIAASTALDVSATYLLPPKEPGIYGPEEGKFDISGANQAVMFGGVPTLAGTLKFPPFIAAVEFVETIGGDRFLNAIFAISDGPVTTPTVWIGETPISEYSEVTTEFRRGYYALTDKGSADISSAYPSSPVFADTWTISAPVTKDGVTYVVGDTITFNGLAAASEAAAWDKNQGKPFSIYPNDVYDEVISTVVSVENGAVTRVTQPDTSSVTCEFVWEGGLVNFEKEPAGKRNDKTAGIKIEYRLNGTSDPWVVGVNTAAKGRNATPVWRGYKFQLPAAGKYDIRVTRTTPDDENDRNVSVFKWLILRSISAASPVPLLGVAMLAINIRASEQLSGSLNTVKVLCTSILRDWDGANWIWRPTANPAAIFRHYLQSPHWQRAVSDSSIDLDEIQDWHEFCTALNLRCNAYFTDDAGMQDRLAQIALTGFAMFAAKDGLWSVVVDRERPAYEQLFTARNVRNYSCEVTHPAPLHSISVNFIDETSDYATNERIVYDDGYDENNAIYTQQLTLPGITNPGTVYKYCRRLLAERRLRREVHQWECDPEALMLDVGARIRFAHDVIAVGIGAARIANYQIQAGTGLVSHVVLDTAFETTAGVDYSLVARPAVGDQLTIRLQEMAGDVSAMPLLVATDEDDLPEIGTLVVFGISGAETIDLVVKGKVPTTDMRCRLTAVLYHEGIFSSDTGDLPQWSSGSVAARSLAAPIVISIQSDTAVMVQTRAGTLIPAILVNLQPVAVPELTVVASWRLSRTDGQWERASVTFGGNSATITGVEDGETYDLKLWYTAPNYLSSPPANISAYTVLGRTDIPSALQNVAGQTIGGQIELRWDRPAEIDVLIGGAIQWRWTPVTTGASWASSTSLNGAEISGASTFIVLPLKPGTYLGRVIDSLGNSSDVVAWPTKQASASTFTLLETVIEHPTFPGTVETCSVVGSVLRLQTGSIDVAQSWDAIPEFDIYGEGVASFGRYYFATGMDFEAVIHVRLTALVFAAMYSTTDLWDDPTDFVDSDEVIDVNTSASGDVVVEMRETDDDPGGSPTWSSWRRLDASEIEARAVQFRAVLWTTAANTNIDVTLLEVRAEIL
jgi:hypothetical protein